MAISISYVNSLGRPIRLGRELGRGGEGAVFESPDVGHERVVKIYHDPLKPNKQAKLSAMVRVGTTDLFANSTWPTDTVHDAHKREIVGILMPRMAGYQEIHVLYGPAHRKKEFPDADWAFLVIAARNIAAATAKFHALGHVIGDINPNNVVVSAKAEVKLIDCDSFQINASGQHYLCDVGVPHFTPPELHNINFDKTLRTPNHDNFGLAVLCFHLLFMGRHPFSGRYLNGAREMPIEQAIREYRFAYGRTAATREMMPPPDSLPFETIPTEMQRMFWQAFTIPQTYSVIRPSAAQWMQQLDSLRNTITECPDQPAHKYPRSLSSCPWCSLESKARIFFFNPKIKSRPAFDFAGTWSRITTVTPPDNPSLPAFTFTLTPRPIAFPSEYSPRQVLAHCQNQKQLREVAVSAATKRLDKAQQQWTQHVTDKSFVDKLNDLRQNRDKYQLYEQRFAAQMKSIESQVRGLQLHDFLDGFYIRRTKLKGIGSTHVAGLASYGIETAADVSWAKVHAVPGFGDVKTSTMVNWRSSLEKQFIFNPTKVSGLSAIVQLRAQHSATLLPIERLLQAGAEELETIKQKLISWEKQLVAELENILKDVEQAKVDLAFAEQETRKAELAAYEFEQTLRRAEQERELAEKRKIDQDLFETEQERKRLANERRIEDEERRKAEQERLLETLNQQGHFQRESDIKIASKTRRTAFFPVVLLILWLTLLLGIFVASLTQERNTSDDLPRVITIIPSTATPFANLLPTVTPTKTPNNPSALSPDSQPPTLATPSITIIVLPDSRTVNVYKGPSDTEPIVSELVHGQPVIITGKTSSGLWCSVKLLDETKGWVRCEIFIK